MSKGVNKAILIGNLGQDPDVRYMPSGDAVANVSLATSETWKDKATGEPREKTEWHRVVFFGKLAEVVKQYVRKGSKIYVEGQLRTRKYQAQDGTDRYTTEVVVAMGGTLQMLDSRQSDRPPHPAAASAGAPTVPGNAYEASQALQAPPAYDADIPF